MKDLVEKAEVLIEALPYIQRFRGARVVVKFGGSAMEQHDRYEGILTDLVFMECVGMQPVLVHGGGKAITRAMAEAGLTARFVQGLRVTDEASMRIVKDVITHRVNQGIVETLQRLGGRAERVDGEAVFQVERRTGKDPLTGATLDWGLVGEIRTVRLEPLLDLLARDVIPVVTPLGTGPDGQTYNLNADDAAAAVAQALQARKLVFLSDVPGVLRDRHDESSLLSTLRLREVEQLIRDGVIDGGMLPKLHSCAQALAGGVQKIHIVDGRLPHSLLLEIFTNQGVGTEITE